MLAAALAAAVVVLAAVAFYLAANRRTKDGRKLKYPPGPTPLPVLGSLHVMGKHEIPFAGFTELMKKYGDVFSLRLGTTDCVVVNTVELRDEVFVTKANDFDGRPNFSRINLLFGGVKDNGRQKVAFNRAFLIPCFPYFQPWPSATFHRFRF